MFKKTEHNGMAIAIAWPEFKGKQPGSWYDVPMRWIGHNKNFEYKVGHAALVLLDKSTGNCSYFDCGRYHAPFLHGRIRSLDTDNNLQIQTKASVKQDKIENISEILHEIQNNNSTFGVGPLYAAYCTINIDLALVQIRKLQNKNPIPFGPFVIKGTNCCRFVRTVILAGEPMFKYNIKLRYSWILKPMPISIVKILSDKIIISETTISNTQRTKKFIYNKQNVKNTLPPPERQENIPPESQWLSGEVAGGWFWIKRGTNKNSYKISRFSTEGILECSGEFKQKDEELNKFDINSPYSFTHLSHCSKTTIKQNNNLFTFYRIN